MRARRDRFAKTLGRRACCELNALGPYTLKIAVAIEVRTENEVLNRAVCHNRRYSQILGLKETIQGVKHGISLLRHHRMPTLFNDVYALIIDRIR